MICHSDIKGFFHDYLYKFGIVVNDDNAIIFEFERSKRFEIVCREEFGIPTNERGDELSSLNARDDPIDFINEASSTEMVLLSKKIFQDTDITILEQFIKHDTIKD